MFDQIVLIWLSLYRLNVDLTLLKKSSPPFGLIKNYLELMHGPTYSSYGMKLLNPFERNKDASFNELDNQMLLWRGFRLSNFVGILNQSLRVAPPETPCVRTCNRNSNSR